MKKSPTTKRKKGMEIRGVKPDKKSSYTNKRGKTVELKRYKSKEYKRTTDPDATKETRRASRRTNTLELSKTKTKKDGTTKTRVKRAAGGTKKAERLSRQFKRGARQQGASDVKIERKSPTTMKKSPSKMKKSMATMKDKSMAKMKKSPAKKPLVGKQKNLPEHLKKAILDAPAKMLSKSGMKMMKEGSPAKLKTKKADKVDKLQKRITKAVVEGKEKKARRLDKKQSKAAGLSPAKMKAPVKKSKQRVEQDYARNAIADYKAGKKKQGNYEKKKALELAAGESGVMMKKSPNMMKTPMEMKKNPMMMKKNPMMLKTNQMGGGVAAKDPSAPAKQLKKLGSILSKHMKSR